MRVLFVCNALAQHQDILVVVREALPGVAIEQRTVVQAITAGHSGYDVAVFYIDCMDSTTSIQIGVVHSMFGCPVFCLRDGELTDGFTRQIALATEENVLFANVHGDVVQWKAALITLLQRNLRAIPV